MGGRCRQQRNLETGWKVASSAENAAALPLGSLALVVWGPYSLDSSLLGSLKKSKDQRGNEKREEESLRVFSQVRAPRPQVAGPRGCRSTWWLAGGTARSGPRSTSETCSCNWTRSRHGAPLPPARSPRRVDGSCGAPSGPGPGRAAGTLCLRCPAALASCSPGSSPGSPPGAPAPAWRWSERCQRWRRGPPRCCLHPAAGPPWELRGTSLSDARPPLGTPAAAASRSAWCSCQTPRGTYTCVSWCPSPPGERARSERARDCAPGESRPLLSCEASCKSTWPAGLVPRLPSQIRLDRLSAPRPGSGWSQVPDSRGCRTHLAAGLVVVQVHGCPSILSCL